MSKPRDIEKEISSRFLSVLSDFTGPGKKYRFKKEFAAAIDMRQQELTKVEKGASIQFRHCALLRDLTGLNLNWLITGKGEKYQGKSNGQMSLEERVSKIEKIISKSVSS